MSEPQDFFAPPQPHHHVARLIVLIAILAIIIVVAWIYSSMSGYGRMEVVENSSTPSTVASVRPETPAEIAESLRNRPPVELTDAERAKIAAEMRKRTVTLTDAEREAIAAELRSR